MTDIESLYKKVDGKILIEIKLSSVMQIFNSFDPAPFHEKEWTLLQNTTLSRL